MNDKLSSRLKSNLAEIALRTIPAIADLPTPPAPLFCGILLHACPHRPPTSLAAPLAALDPLGFILRLYFIWSPRTIDDDTWDYLELGRNLLHHWGLRPRLRRRSCSQSLPVARLSHHSRIFNQLFGSLPHSGWLVALYLFQSQSTSSDAFSLAAFAYRFISPRAGEIALALARTLPLHRCGSRHCYDRVPLHLRRLAGNLRRRRISQHKRPAFISSTRAP